MGGRKDDCHRDPELARYPQSARRGRGRHQASAGGLVSPPSPAGGLRISRKLRISVTIVFSTAHSDSSPERFSFSDPISSSIELILSSPWTPRSLSLSN